MKAIKIKIDSYATVRFFLTLLVVVGHCTYYTINTKYGGINWGNTMLLNGVKDTVSHKITLIISDLIYSFHMPMFFALSGALFEYGNKKNLHTIITNKAKKLLIPFCFVTIFSVILKYLIGYWSNSSNIFKDILIGQLMLQGNTHLWFLPTLFLEFIFFCLIFKLETKQKNIKLLLFAFFFFCSIVYSGIPIIIFNYFYHYMLFFYIGMLFERNREIWDIYLNKIYIIIIFLLTWLLLFNIKKYFIDTIIIPLIIKNMMSTLIAISGILFFYSFCLALSKTKIKNQRFFKFVEKYSFGIYLYSDTFNYIILYFFVYFLSINAFGNELFATLLFFYRLIITFIISVLISKLINKCNIKYLT